MPSSTFRCVPVDPGAGDAAGSGQPVVGSAAAIAWARQALLAGKVLAVQGTGGYHLVCSARNEACLVQLRLAKARPHKPFAVMFRHLVALRAEVDCSPETEELLACAAHPIVILPRAPISTLPAGLAPGLNSLGVMLPYTLLYEALFPEELDALVVTSANSNGAPTICTETGILGEFRHVISAVITHGSPIVQPADDSVWRSSPAPTSQGNAPCPVLIRRSRGYVPEPVALPLPLPACVLGVGGDLKAVFCLARGEEAFPSAYLGDLTRVETVERYWRALSLYRRLLGIEPQAIACDAHPGWVSGQLGARQEWRHLPRFVVQHHHAHIAACMGENGVVGPVLGVAYDGTGYGSDGTAWGGEFLRCSLQSSHRLAAWQPVPLPGGDRAITQPWRMALSYLQEAGIDNPVARLGGLPAAAVAAAEDLAAAWRQYKGAWPVTSSMGRLFDGVSALLGFCGEITYEGQAAILLEEQAWLAVRREGAHAITPLACAPAVAASATALVPTAPLVRAVTAQHALGVPPGIIAARFHRTVAFVTAQVAGRLCGEQRLDTVALSGGVWQNQLLRHWTGQYLERAGLQVISHRMLSPNDGCIGYGQAIVAGAQMTAREQPSAAAGGRRHARTN